MKRLRQNAGADAAAARNSWLAVAISFVVLCLIALAWPDVRRGHTDFRSFYAGAKLAGTPDLYSPSHVHEIQKNYGKPGELKAYTRPPFYALLLWPLGKLPYRVANILWQLINVAALAGFILLWSPHALAAMICCWYLPLWINYTSGQDVPLILLVFSLSAFLLRRGRNFLAGLLFVLCGVKFHLFLLLPLVVVGKRLWRFAAGFAAGSMALLGVSFLSAGPDWPARQLALLRLNELSEASQSYMPTLNGLFYSVPLRTLWLALSTLAVAWMTWYVIRRSSLRHALAVMLCGGLLVGVHGFLYDCAVLLPLYLSIGSRSGFRRAIALSMTVGISTVALSTPSVSFLGQLAIILLFCYVVYDAYRHQSRAALEDRGPA